MKTELRLAIFPDGRQYLEVDSMIAWAKEMAKDSNPQLKFAMTVLIHTVEGMRDKALNNPSKIEVEGEEPQDVH